MRYIYNHPDWPNFTWNDSDLLHILGEVRHMQGMLAGKMSALGFRLQADTYLETLARDILKTSEIEGELLDDHQVRSSIARSLGMNLKEMVESNRNVDGVVEMMLDATTNFTQPLTDEKLFAWHRSLFPDGQSGLYKVLTGQWRDDSTGPMQVVSGALGKERVHYQAPDAKRLKKEMDAFFAWVNNTATKIEPLIKAGIAHLWFVTIHPFDDGNGRIARAIADSLLARSENSAQRYYSMSAQIQAERKEYYNILESVQKSDMNITPWLEWFLICLKNAIINANQVIEKVMVKHRFWLTHKTKTFNERQLSMIDKLMNDFKGKLTNAKWAKMNKCSSDTALRDIRDLIDKKVLRKEEAGGRSTHYSLVTA